MFSFSLVRAGLALCIYVYYANVERRDVIRNRVVSNLLQSTLNMSNNMC